MSRNILKFDIELLSLLHWTFRKPKNFILTSNFFINKFIDKIIKIFFPSFFYYPISIKKLVKIHHDKYGRGSILRNNKHIHKIFDNFPAPVTLKLATGYFTLKSKNDWLTSFTDSEQFVSLHRWGWLLHLLIDEPATKEEWGISLMRSWLSLFPPIPKNLAGETYSTGERIVNAILFFYYFQRKDISQLIVPLDIRQAIEEMACHIVKNLEYEREGQTCNHIIQNARALLCAGRLLNIESFSEIGYALLKRELSKMVTAQGFLREGSSHYQFIFTRWLLEISFFSNNEKCSKLFDLIIPKLLEKCLFFLVYENYSEKWQIPLIGDISPDNEPSWLVNIPWSPLAKKYYQSNINSPSPLERGWTNLWQNNPQDIRDLNVLKSENKPTHSFQSFPESGWFRLDIGKFTYFWHIESREGYYNINHAHCDTGAFVMFWNGVQILGDPGRPSYEKQDQFYDYSGSAQAHNTLTIDDLSIFSNIRDFWFPLEYGKPTVYTKWKWSEDGFLFSISHNGFARMGNDQILHTRTFHIMEQSLKIEDFLEGKNLHEIKTYFHWTPEIQLSLQESQNEILYIKRPDINFNGILQLQKNTTEEMEVEIYRGEKSDIVSGWFFPAYGCVEKTSTIIITKKGKFPLKNTYLFTWKG